MNEIGVFKTIQEYVLFPTVPTERLANYSTEHKGIAIYFAKA